MNLYFFLESIKFCGDNYPQTLIKRSANSQTLFVWTPI